MIADHALLSTGGVVDFLLAPPCAVLARLGGTPEAPPPAKARVHVV